VPAELYALSCQPDRRVKNFQGVLLMVFGTTPQIVRKTRGHKIVE